jgi:hypothetical protein
VIFDPEISSKVPIAHWASNLEGSPAIVSMIKEILPGELGMRKFARRRLLRSLTVPSKSCP